MKLPRVAFAFLLSVLGLASQLLAKPTITTPPDNSTITIGQSTTFLVAAATSGGALTYQWQGSKDGGGTWSNLSIGAPFGATVTQPTLSLSQPAYWMNGAKVRCQVTDSNGTSESGSATLTINTPAPLLILAPPTPKSAFQGDVSTSYSVVTRDIAGTGLTYLWQVSTDNATTWTSLTDDTTYAGSTTATLTIADPYTNLGGVTGAGIPRRYRCRVTSGSYVFNSRNATLTIYATPTYAPTVLLKVNGSTAASMTSTETGPVMVEVSGVPVGGAVRIGRYADIDGDGVIDHGEPLVQSFGVTDGAMKTYGGVPDPDIPGDTDGVADGTIQAVFSLAKMAELGRGAGNYLFRVTSATGDFRPVDTTTFSITQPALGQSVTGTVNVPYAQVALLQQVGQDSMFVGAVLAEGSGNFSIQAAPGTYVVLALAPGYVANMGAAPTAVLGSGVDTPVGAVTLTPADYINSLMLLDQATSTGLRGVQIFFEAKTNGYVTIANTDNSGVATAAAVAQADWAYDISSDSLTTMGYVRPNNNNGNVLGSTNMGLPLLAANALLYGTLTDNSATPVPLAGVNINAGDNGNIYSTDTHTNATGHYYLPVYGSGANWSVNVDSQAPIWGTTYTAPQSQTTAVVSGNAYPLNFVATAVTAHLTGTVVNADHSNAPVGGVQVNLYKVNGMMTNFVGSTTTNAVTGAFSFGVTAGSWVISLESNSASSNNLVGPVLPFPTVTDGNDVTGITLSVRDGTGTMSGTVLDFNGAPLSNANVNASATISTVVYNAGIQTDGSGHYSFPVINGDWTVNANSGALRFAQQAVTVSGATTTLNLSPTVFWSGPFDQSGIMSGSPAGFNANVNNSGLTAVTMQWEMNTGTGWGNVPNAAPYFGVSGNSLSINPVTIDLSGNQYRLAVSFTYLATPHTEYSTAATLTVSGSAPSITSQPSSANITASGGTSFIVGAYGTPSPSYQWQYSTDGGSPFSNLGDGGSFSGTQTDTLVVNNAATTISGYQFKCVVANGVGADAVSDVVTLTVNAASQAVTFNGQTLTKDVAATLGATATSGLTNFNYSVQSSTTTSDLSGDQLTITGYGTVTVRATQPGNEYYASAYQDATFTVNKLSGSVTLGNLSATYDGSPKNASATTTPVGGLTVNFTYTPPGDSTAPTNAGSYTVVGTINDSTYQGSATDVLVIAKAGQTITFAGPGDQTYSATPITLSATGGGSGNPVTFSLDSGPANLSGTNNSTLTLTGPGTVVVRASQAASANYNSATDVVRSIVVSPAATGFAAWRNAKFTAGELADLNISGPNAVYGQDGLPNLVKYALGLEPKQNITTGLPAVTTTATDWVYTYQHPDSITDVTYTVEYSTDLATWSPLTDSFVSNAGGFDTRKATYPLGSATKIYFRLNITQP